MEIVIILFVFWWPRGPWGAAGGTVAALSLCAGSEFLWGLRACPAQAVRGRVGVFWDGRGATAAGWGWTSTAGWATGCTPPPSGLRSGRSGCPDTGCCPRDGAWRYCQSVPISVGDKTLWFLLFKIISIFVNITKAISSCNIIQDVS